PRLPPSVLLYELGVGIGPLGILVEPLHVRVRREVVEVEVVLLDVLAVVGLGGDEAEKPLLQDGVALVPEGEREDQELVAVADAGEPVFAPAVGLAAGKIVGEVVPGRAVRPVVFADGSPRALGYVGAPAPPGHEVAVTLGQSLVLARAGLRAGAGVHR